VKIAFAICIFTLATVNCAHDAPRLRRGGLPNPGLLTLFSLADPDHLGTTRYERRPPFLGTYECGHGILYTERAGFLDMAHIRMAMDWSRYVAQKVATALARQSGEVILARQDDSAFRISFAYPADWQSFPDSTRTRLTAELSRRIGERVALDIGTWHELITWFGFGSFYFVTEKASAFTYEDIASHAIAIQAADVALHGEGAAWNTNATRALNEELTKLGVVSRARARTAVELVRNKWWTHGVCIKRLVDIGDTDGSIHPWLVRGMPGGDQPAEAFRIPTLNDVDGRDFTGIYTLTITPGRHIPKEIRAVLPGHPSTIEPSRDFPYLLEEVRQQVKRQFGPTADQPYDDEEE
jgi:hypothetical protein